MKDDDIKIEYRSVEALIPYARNARTHSDKQVTKLAASIREFGWTNPILVDGNNGIVAGHCRLHAAKKLGLTRVPVIELAYLTDAQKRAYILADNQLAISGSGWDDELLRIELSELKEEDFDLSLTGFDDAEIDRMLAEVEEEPVNQGYTDEDAVPEEQEETVSHEGDVWIMGPHRLLVGDCTKEENYERLLDGEHAALVVTDPPYNVAYQGAAGTIQNDDLGEGFRDFLVSALKPMLERCDGACYIAMSSSELDALQSAFRECGGHWSTFIIWAKDRFTLGRSDYQRQYEPLLYGWREGAKHFWCGARDQGDVWQISKPARNEFHPCLPAGQKVFFNGKWKNIEDVGIGEKNQYGEVRAKTEHEAERLVEIQAEGQTTVATWNHPFLVKRDESVFWIDAEKLKPGDALLVSKCLEEDTCGNLPEKDIFESPALMEDQGCCMTLSGKLSTVPSRRDTRYITGMGTNSTITLKTSSLSLPLSTSGYTLVAELTNEEYGKSLAKSAGSLKSARQNIGISTKMDGSEAVDAGHALSGRSLRTVEFGLRMVGSVSIIQRRIKVYNLSVSPLPLFDTKVGISHNTMKPVELFERCLRNSSEPGDIVLDCFAGSGTTIIACEKAGRVARLMEIDPKYADVIVRRWQEFTGKKAVREADGAEFADVIDGLAREHSEE